MNYFKSIALLDGLGRRTPGVYPYLRRLWKIVDALPVTERVAWQEKRCAVILSAAARTDYGRKFADRPLATWPILEKETVRSTLGRLLTKRHVVKISSRTGGSSGQAVALQRSWLSVVAEQVSIDHICEIGGLDLRRCKTAVLRADPVKVIDDQNPPYWKLVGSQRALMSTRHLNKTTLASFVDFLTSFRTDCLYCYPSAAERLCQLLQAGGYKLRIPFVLASSEMLSESARRLIRTTLGAQVLDYYGQAERVCMAYRWNESPWTFLPAYGHVELHRLDDSHEVVATGLWNTRLPLVRYRTNDIVGLNVNETAADLKAIEVGCRGFPEIGGRSMEYFATATGGRVVGLNHISRDARKIIRMQLIQRSFEDVLVNVAEEQSFDDSDAEHLRAIIHARMPELKRIEICVGGLFRKTAQGKTPFVIREMD